MLNRITPDNIQSLQINEVFVFGSNLSGIHGGGAANLAHEKFGAEWGIGMGDTGQCYALPTKDYGISRTLKVEEIKEYVDFFIEIAKKNISYIYLVTEIGCGLAGYKPEDIAPLFKEAISINNIYLPKRFWEILGY